MFLSCGAAVREGAEVAPAPLLLQRLVNLDVTPQYVGQEVRQIDTLLFSLTGEVLPDTSLNRDGQEDFRPGRNVMKTPYSLTEVDL